LVIESGILGGQWWLGDGQRYDLRADPLETDPQKWRGEPDSLRQAFIAQIESDPDPGPGNRNNMRRESA
jgi:hypothetical protein